MKPLLMVIDDNVDLLWNIKLMLENNNYRVIDAKNGKDALNKLKNLDSPPDLFICDIMMPEMDGYEFFELVLNNDKWSNIPFIFLTAKTSPEDIRFGKVLGVDDYITKPFNEKDLLAIISGKLLRKKMNISINKKINKLFYNSDDLTEKITSNQGQDDVVFLFVIWDDTIGPKLAFYYPENIEFSYSIEEIGTQLFHSISSIYGEKNINKAQGFLLTIENINKQGYIYFDSYYDKDARGGERRYMLALIDSKIKIISTFKIKECFNEISTLIKNDNAWKIEDYWEKLIGSL
ncbi:MAG: response regulator [Promethearchaeota archaeon]|nr:MAG: response regulator [Candidatus Lokiarchaeota archaeon]